MHVDSSCNVPSLSGQYPSQDHAASSIVSISKQSLMSHSGMSGAYLMASELLSGTKVGDPAYYPSYHP